MSPVSYRKKTINSTPKMDEHFDACLRMPAELFLLICNVKVFVLLSSSAHMQTK